MASIETYEEDDWQNLSFRIDDLFTHYNNYIYRGQADTDWKLESTLDRAVRVIYEKPSERRDAAERHFKQFKGNIRGRTSIDLNDSTDDEIWSLGQHFGLNTPLLDWTRSPYVGLFFSFIGPCKSGKRALWAILESDLDEINSTNRKSS